MCDLCYQAFVHKGLLSQIPIPKDISFHVNIVPNKLPQKQRVDNHLLVHTGINLFMCDQVIKLLLSKVGLAINISQRIDQFDVIIAPSNSNNTRAAISAIYTTAQDKTPRKPKYIYHIISSRGNWTT